MPDRLGATARTTAFLAPYRRTTSTGRFIPEIDGLRFAAISSVFLYHLAGDVLRRASGDFAKSVESNPLFLLTQVLNVGVPLFFVISGFILSLPFAEAHRNLRRPVSLKQYYWRRVTRIEPPYLICLLLFFLLKVAAGRETAVRLLPHLLASSVYMHNAVFGRPSDIFVVAWSLEIEVQFYLLAPFLAAIFAIRRDAIRRAMLLAALLLATGLSRFAWNHQPLELSLLAYLHFFLAGFLLAEFYLYDRKRRKSRQWDVLWLAGIIGLFWLPVTGKSAGDWLSPWLLLLLSTGAFLGTATSRFFANPWIATIGGMCYSIIFSTIT